MNDEKLKTVGQSKPRLDAKDKVTGRAKYIDDIAFDGVWYGVVVRSTMPRAKIKRVYMEPDFDWSKVVTADWRDIPGKNFIYQMKEDQPCLAETQVNHVGEAVVLIAAPTRSLAQEAASHVKIDFEPLPAVLTIEESSSKKEIVYNNDNIIAHYDIVHGDLAAGFAQADLIIEGEYRTPQHEHIYLEPQGVVATPRKDGGMTVEGSLQCPYYVLPAIANLLGLPHEKVNARQTIMGGAFGGKEDYPSLLGGYAAILAWKSKKPVKIIYDRDEDILVTTKRHPSLVRHKTGVKKDGTLVAMQIDVNLDGGAYTTISPVVLARGVLHSWGPYRCPNVKAVATCWATNTVPNGAFRGFGAPQTLFAIESHMDVIANKLGISPAAIREKNALRLGDETATGQILKESVSAIECLNSAKKRSCFDTKWAEYNQNNKNAGGHIRKGIGVALFMHGAGFTGSGEAVMRAKAAVRVVKGGKVEILTACTDMGQGAHSVLPQIVAETIGVSLDRVSCVTPDTAVVPNSGPTVASRTTMVIGRVLSKCAEKIRERLCEHGASLRGIDPAEVSIRDDGLWNGHGRLLDFDALAASYLDKEKYLVVQDEFSLPKGIVWNQDTYRGDAYPAFSWACDVAEVEVDVETFEVTVKKMTHAYDIGKAINPQFVEGQIEGGTLQAMGWGVMEDAKYKDGRILNNKLQTYIIPTVLDAPEHETDIIENAFSWGPYGAKGLGELPLDGGAAAIANAVFNAIGIRIADLPITAEKIFKVTTLSS